MRLAEGLCQFLYNMFGEDFVYFIMPGHRLLLTRFWITVKIVSIAVSQENTSDRSDFFDEVSSFHTAKMSSLTSCSAGTSSIRI